MTHGPWFRPMRHGAGLAPAAWQARAAVAAFAVLLAAVAWLVFALMAEPMVAGALFMAAAGLLTAAFLWLARRLARAG